MPNVPKLPNGMTPAQFGQEIMKWGTGHAAAESQIGKLDIDELYSAGLTAEIAAHWRDFYKAVCVRTPNNPSARGRAKLMEHVRILLERN